MKTKALLSFYMLLVCTLGLRAQESTHWQCDVYEYEYDMTVYFRLQQGTEAVTDYSDYEVAAFVGEECRGVASFLTVQDETGNDVQYGYLRIRSNQAQGETVGFKAYQASTGKTLQVSETVAFQDLHVAGLPSDLFTLTMATYRPGDVNGDGNVNSVDLSMMIDRILHIENPNFIEAAGDINGDGNINSVDFSLLINLILHI